MYETTIVRGDGLAAACCVRSLAMHRMPVALGTAHRSSRSAILLNGATQNLLADLFCDQQLFHGLPRIRRRVVAWGPGAEAVVLPHAAVAITEEELLRRLWVSASEAIEPAGDEAAWQVISTRSGLPEREEKSFGSRTARVSEVRFRAATDQEACWTESLDAGWLFLFPVRAETGCLIAVGGSVAELLAQSRLIAPLVAWEEAELPAERVVPAYPRILSQLCGPGWLACGSAAMAFDPLCGEGAGNSVREAILAAAVIHAAAQKRDLECLLAHYHARLMGGFLRHLELCRRFYSTGGTGEFWRRELELLEQGGVWLREQMPSQLPARFRLAGFELVPV